MYQEERSLSPGAFGWTKRAPLAAATPSSAGCSLFRGLRTEREELRKEEILVRSWEAENGESQRPEEEKPPSAITPPAERRAAALI
jgi:hypothetical protein